MTDFYKIIDGNYISGFGTNGNDSVTAITEAEYNELVSVFRSAPKAPDGYAYRLRADSPEWELVELPPAAEDEEATAEDYEAALAEMGVFDRDEG